MKGVLPCLCVNSQQNSIKLCRLPRRPPAATAAVKESLHAVVCACVTHVPLV
jgi:hypothetical protein